jgi:hypothetical protein
VSWFDDNFDDIVFGHPFEPRPHSCAPEEKTCNRCGATGLHWANDGRSWYLVDAQTYDEHECDEKDLQAKVLDEFEDLDA